MWKSVVGYSGRPDLLEDHVGYLEKLSDEVDGEWCCRCRVSFCTRQRLKQMISLQRKSRTLDAVKNCTFVIAKASWASSSSLDGGGGAVASVSGFCDEVADGYSLRPPNIVIAI